MKTVNRVTGFYGLMEARNLGIIAALRNEPWTSNPFSVGSGQWEAWCDGYNECLAQLAAEQEQVRLRIAGGEPIHSIESDLDLRENRQRAGLIERFISWAKKLVGDMS